MYKFGIVDADTLPYSVGNKYDEMAFPTEVTLDVDRIFRQLHKDIKTEDCNYYLTDSKSNFRNDIANLRKYKGNRHPDKPYYFEFIRDYIMEKYDGIMCYGKEADDVCADALIESGDDGVCVSIDKDLDCAHGHHFRPKWGMVKSAKHYYMTKHESLVFYHRQWLTGDVSVDNIGGAHLIGKAKADQIITEDQTKKEMQSAVEETYLKVYGSAPREITDWRGRKIKMNWKQIMKENQQLIFMGMKNRPKFNYEDNYELL